MGGAAMATAGFVAGDAELLASAVAALWLILLPWLAALEDPSPPERIRDGRRALYLGTIALMGLGGGFTLLLTATLAAHTASPSPALLHPPPPGPLFVATGLLVAAGTATAFLFRALSARFGWRETAAVHAIMPTTPSERHLFILLAIVASTAEEIVFRGFLPLFLARWLGSAAAAALPATVAFGILHRYQGGHGMVRTAVLGLLLAGGVLWTGSLWPAILAHIILNLLFAFALRDSLLGGHDGH